MNGIHDMGGMQCFGAVRPEANDAAFHAPWESRLFAIFLSVSRHGPFDPGGGRLALESLHPVQYLSGYYERFLMVLEKALLQRRFLTEEEMNDRTEFFRAHPEAVPPQRKDPELVKKTMKMLYNRHSSQRDVGGTPRFVVGDNVYVRNISPRGHTRLPRYVRGKAGVVERIHGVHDIHDTEGGRPEGPPQAVYSVRFDAGELWGESAEPNQSLNIDMWESYLLPA